MRKLLPLLCVLFILASCQSEADMQEQLKQQAQQQAQQQVDKATDEANKAKDSFFDKVGQTVGSWTKPIWNWWSGVVDWWDGIWGKKPGSGSVPVPEPGSGTGSSSDTEPKPEYPRIYVINTDGALGRPCANRSTQCSINVKSFNRGDEITVTGIIQGESVNGNNNWLVISFENLTKYVHSSVADPKPLQPESQGPAPSEDIPASVPPLDVPFRTEIGSADVPGKGSQNCGPASIAMVLGYYGTSMTTKEAAIEIRKPEKNVNGQDGTDFEGTTSTGLLTLHNLSVNTSVSTYSDIQKELRDGRPVIILVNNKQYRKNEPAPYVNDGGDWFVVNHIIVVTGYDPEFVYVNDPLRFESKSLPHPENYKIPVETFKKAASTTPQSTETKWYAMSVFKKP